MTQSPVLTNPLKEGLTIEQATEPCAMVIFGAHGDLTKRKLIPALYALYCDGFLPYEFCVVGLSRTEMTDQAFRDAMQASLIKYAGDIPYDAAKWEKFAAHLYYRSAYFDKEGGLAVLASFLQEAEVRHGTKGNNLYYLSTPPSLYQPIIARLQEAGLNERHEGERAPWPRIIVEKPFGHDLATAHDLDDKLHGAFSEDQIFRIDHYLGKETVQNIMVLRFANGIFEPLWNRQHIDHVQITNAETLGVEGRGGYYEEAGNLRDMVQNHMMQLLALVAMEPPISMSAESTRDERAKVLRCIRPFDLSRLSQEVVRGQYSAGYIVGEPVPGYREEPSVNPGSRTETFSAMKIFIDNWRWADVPFYVRSGKRLAKGVTEVAVHFKQAPLRLFNQALHDEGEVSRPNVLVLKIQPDEGISLKFATKQPGTATRLRWLSMDFKYGSAFGGRTPVAYERLVHDCILGDASLFARTDFVSASWKLISPVLDAWQKDESVNFPNYAAGSWGPPESEEMLLRDGRAWRVP